MVMNLLDLKHSPRAPRGKSAETKKPAATASTDSRYLSVSGSATKEWYASAAAALRASCCAATLSATPANASVEMVEMHVCVHQPPLP
jgi:hypothetical protein